MMSDDRSVPSVTPPPLTLVPAGPSDVVVPTHVVVPSVVVTLEGELTANHVVTLHAQLFDLIVDLAPADVLLDLTGVTAIDLVGVRMLLGARRRHLRRHNRFEVDAVSPAVADFFDRHKGLAGLLMPSFVFTWAADPSPSTWGRAAEV